MFFISILRNFHRMVTTSSIISHVLTCISDTHGILVEQRELWYRGIHDPTPSPLRLLMLSFPFLSIPTSRNAVWLRVIITCERQLPWSSLTFTKIPSCSSPRWGWLCASSLIATFRSGTVESGSLLRKVSHSDLPTITNLLTLMVRLNCSRSRAFHWEKC